MARWRHQINAQINVLPCLVMIPGTLCDQRLFKVQKLKLRGRANVILVDYKSMGCLQTWAGELLKRLPLHFSLAGFSLGGLWALELLKQAPHRVDRLAMIASNARGASQRGRKKCQKMHRNWRAFGPSAVILPVMSSYFHNLRLARKNAKLIEAMAVNTCSPDAYTQFAWAGQRPDSHAALTAFDGPVLLVSGEHDPICPRSWQQSMVASSPQARWVELPRIGHFVPLEAPSRLGQLLAQWLLQPVHLAPTDKFLPSLTT